VRIIREAECRALTGLSRSTRYRLERCCLFPKRRLLSECAVGWFEAEVLGVGTLAPTVQR
jgi:prophage regulatory protein